jgi:P-type conjugative transfer protein TrbJ
MHTATRKLVLAAAIALVASSSSLMFAPPASAQWAVFDAANFSQNIMTQLNTLTTTMNQVTQLEHEVQSLTNQATMLQNDARNLTSLPDSLLSNYTNTFSQLMQRFQSIQGLMQSVSAATNQYSTLYPNFQNSVPGGAQLQQLVNQWQNGNAQNIQSALEQGAQILQSLPSSQTDIARLANDSQSATGALQAMQAGNQLTVAVAGQLQQMNAQNAVYQQAVLQKMAADNAVLQLSAQQQTQSYAPLTSGQQPAAPDPSTVKWSY